MRLVSASLAIAAVAAVVGCKSGPGYGVDVRRGAKDPTIPLASHRADPLPTPLGGRSVGRVTHKRAAASLADSVFRLWGWRVAGADSVAPRLETAWLYIPRGTFQRGYGSQCEPGSFTAVRFVLSGQPAGDHTEFFLRAEAKVFSDTPRLEAERAARGVFSAVGADLAVTLRGADARPDAFGVALREPWGEVALSSLGNAAMCGGR